MFSQKPTIVIFGAGKSGEAAYKLLSATKNIRAFVDNNSTRQGKKLFEKPILSPVDAIKLNPKEIWIASMYATEISAQLLRMKVNRGDIKVFDPQSTEGSPIPTSSASLFCPPTHEEIATAYLFLCGVTPSAKTIEDLYNTAINQNLNAPSLSTAILTRSTTDAFGFNDFGRKGIIYDFKCHNGMTLSGPISDLIVTRSIAMSGTWEPEEEAIMRALVKPGQTAIDIGANIGYFSAILSELVGFQGVVYAVEAAPLLVKALERLKKQNNLTQLNIIGAAASECREKLLLTYNYLCFGGSLITPLNSPDQKPTSDREIIIDAIPLDDAFKDIQKLDFIKIDVEGAEGKVFAGMQATIAKFKPDILLEVSPILLERLGSSAEAIIKMLEGHGYRFLSPQEASNNLSNLRTYAKNNTRTSAQILKLIIDASPQYTNVLAIARF